MRHTNITYGYTNRIKEDPLPLNLADILAYILIQSWNTNKTP